MAYIGKQPIVGNYQVLDAIVATTTDTYALTKDTVAVFPQTPSNCIVSLNGVIQAPVDSYTISGSDIVFASALTGTDSIDFITVLGDVLSIGTPTDGTVSLAKLSATGTKDATTFLRGDNTFASAGITEADIWRLTADISSGTNADITANLERSDTANYGLLGSGMTQSSGIFTFPSTGMWQILVQTTYFYNNQADNVGNVQTNISSDGSSYVTHTETAGGEGNGGGGSTYSTFSQCLIDVTNASNFRAKFTTASLGGTVQGSTSKNMTSFSFIRLGDT
jgi:hypothetical protein